MEYAIKAENISKVFRLGASVRGFNDLRDYLAGLFQSGYQRISGLDSARNEDVLWALKDVSFTVGHGETLGLIGRNGSGKSTLLKILSRITPPTGGCADIYGRIGSMLEVGTGFHPELTGRENIYLSGSFLGMSRREIDSCFDDIVDFSEISKFLDTPVKRYSSGMYVRLAFAVTSHLQTDILLIDEVLAVGDIGFRMKCMKRMSEITRMGRTIIFVNHHMYAIRKMCRRVLLLDRGRLLLDGEAEASIRAYMDLSGESDDGSEWRRTGDPPDAGVYLCRVAITDDTGKPKSDFLTSDNIHVSITVFCPGPPSVVCPVVIVQDSFEAPIFTSAPFRAGWISEPLKEGETTFNVTIPRNLLNAGMFRLSVSLLREKSQELEQIPSSLSFTVIDDIGHSEFGGKWLGPLRPILDWRKEQ